VLIGHLDSQELGLLGELGGQVQKPLAKLRQSA
jgi:hypothetical protein